jgi:hypothetical protein
MKKCSQRGVELVRPIGGARQRIRQREMSAGRVLLLAVPGDVGAAGQSKKDDRSRMTPSMIVILRSAQPPVCKTDLNAWPCLRQERWSTGARLKLLRSHG